MGGERRERERGGQKKWQMEKEWREEGEEWEGKRNGREEGRSRPGGK